MTGQEILALPMGENDVKASTIKNYLKALLAVLWKEEQGFSGKRPFGTSGWQWDVYAALVKADLIDGTLDEDGNLGLGSFDRREADALIQSAIEAL